LHGKHCFARVPAGCRFGRLMSDDYNARLTTTRIPDPLR